MELIEKRYTYKSRSDHFVYVPHGDSHVGNSGCDMDGIKDDLDGADIIVLMGDILDCINPSDKRFDPKSVHPHLLSCGRNFTRIIRTQIDMAVDIYYPYRDKIIGLIEGNHERTIRLRGDINPTEEIIWGLWPEHKKDDDFFKSKYLSYMAIITLLFERSPAPGRKGPVSAFKIWAHHGFGGGRKPGSKINNISDIPKDFPNCNIYCMGHVHYKYIGAVASLDVSASNPCKLKATDKLIVLTGTRLKTYQEQTDQYTELSAYPPTSLGSPKLIIHPDSGEIEAISTFKVK